MKPKLKWIAVVLLVLFVGLGTFLFLLPRDRITVESWKQIRLGMTEKEVEEFLGGPGLSPPEFQAQYDRWKARIGKPFAYLGGVESEGNHSGPAKHWWVKRGIIEIQFDQGGNVEGKRFWEHRSTEPSLLDRLGAWCGWPQRHEYKGVGP
jgi:hypothetical protein